MVKQHVIIHTRSLHIAICMSYIYILHPDAHMCCVEMHVLSLRVNGSVQKWFISTHQLKLGLAWNKELVVFLLCLWCNSTASLASLFLYIPQTFVWAVPRSLLEQLYYHYITMAILHTPLTHTHTHTYTITHMGMNLVIATIYSLVWKWCIIIVQPSSKKRTPDTYVLYLC